MLRYCFLIMIATLFQSDLIAESLKLLGGYDWVSIADNMRHNGASSEMWYARKEGKADLIVDDIKRQWESDGKTVLIKTSGQWTIASVLDLSSGDLTTAQSRMIRDSKVEVILASTNILQKRSHQKSPFRFYPASKTLSSTVSEEEDGRKSSTVVFTNGATVMENITHYQRELPKEGWRIQRVINSEPNAIKGDTVLYATRQQKILHLVFSGGPKGGTTSVATLMDDFAE